MPSSIWQSTSANSNFRINKDASNLVTYRSSGNAVGTNITWGYGYGLNTTGQFSIGRLPINTGAQKLMIYGTDNSVNGPHIQTFTNSDNYPLFQLQSQSHNQVKCNFDLYWDGTDLRSSNSGSNFQLGKASNQFQIVCGGGNAQGNIATLVVGSYWDTSGNFFCNQGITGARLSLSAQPCLMMSASSYMSVSTATPTKFTGFDTTDYTSGSIGFTGGSTATAPTLGTYLVTCEMAFDANGTGTGNYNEIYIYKNGTTIYGRQRNSNSVGNIMCLTTSAQMRLAASDTIELRKAVPTSTQVRYQMVQQG